MQCKSKTFLLSLLIVAASATVVTSSIAENMGDVDPPRWAQRHDATSPVPDFEERSRRSLSGGGGRMQGNESGRS